MKNVKQFIAGVLVGLSFLGITVSAGTYLFPGGGGTGTSTPPTYGQMLVGNAGGTYTLTATSSLGIAGGAGNTFAYPFTTATNYGVTTSATGTPLWAQAGIMASTTSYFANASTTILTSPKAYITALSNLTSNGFVKTSAGIGTLSIDTSTYLTGNQSITLSGAVSGTGATAITTSYSGTVPIANGGTATTTQVTNGVNYYDGTKITSSTALIFDGTKLTAPNISATNSTSTGKLNIPNSSSPSVVVTGDIAIDTTSDQLIGFGGSAKKVYGNGNIYGSFTYATSTAWTGTTTIPVGTAFVAETWNGAQCYTDIGTLQVDFYHTSTHITPMFNASTTANTNLFSGNTTLTAGEKRYIDIGTPATAPTKISCTISRSLTAD